MSSNLSRMTNSSSNNIKQKHCPSILTQKLNRMLSHQNTSKKWKDNSRPNNNAVLSPLRPTLNQTSFSLQQKSMDGNENSSSYLRKQIIHTPKVSNYSEDLNTMMESYFSKKLKQIRTNIAELHQKEKEKGLHPKKNTNIKYFPLNKKAEPKNIITIVDKNHQMESLNNSNAISQSHKKELNESGTKVKQTKRLTQNNSYNSTQSKHHNHTNEKESTKNDEKKKELISVIKEKQKQEAVKERREKSNLLNRQDKINGIKCEYYADNNCVHRFFICNNDIKSLKKIKESLKELLSIVFRKEIEVNIAVKTKKTSVTNSIIDNDIANTPHKEKEPMMTEDYTRSKEGKEFRNMIKGKEAKYNKMKIKANHINQKAASIDQESSTQINKKDKEKNKTETGINDHYSITYEQMNSDSRVINNEVIANTISDNDNDNHNEEEDQKDESNNNHLEIKKV